MSATAKRFKRYQQELDRHGQGHLSAFWDELDQTQRARLLDDLDQVDFEQCRSLIDAFLLNRPDFKVPDRLEPPVTFPATPGPELKDLYRRARKIGTDAIRAGEVAAFTAAGGQGTRLGYDGPKGGFKISPVRGACLFQLFAEYLLGTQRRFGHRPRWYIMTSPSNHTATREIFERHNYFGLSDEDVMFFPQGQMPAFFPDGRIALAEKHRLVLSPDGHGGSLRALATSRALDDMQARGIEHISYFQVDNPLVKVLDPLFIGLHIETGSEMSSKAVTKAHPLEGVGNFCLANGKLTVIEYSDLPDELAYARHPDGTWRFQAGSIAIHVLMRSFVERLTEAGAAGQLPWHRAVKQVAVVNASGNVVTPSAPNVVKLESFVFDAIPLANNPLVLYTPREEEFSPVKNAEGPDSAATARRDLVRRAARWLEACRCPVPRNAAGEPDLPLEISPAFALDADDLRERLVAPPELKPGQALLLT
ncbi:MAG: UTP--glucose-1-phosphate uridylyltransferase [Phycisphaerae bacterium]